MWLGELVIFTVLVFGFTLASGLRSMSSVQAMAWAHEDDVSDVLETGRQGKVGRCSVEGP